MMISKIAKPIAMAATAIAFCLPASAQSLDEGMKMVQYERYNAAKTILQPMAEKDAMANYYLGIAELEQGNTDVADAIFKKYPDDAANIAGMSRVAFARENGVEGRKMAMAAAEKSKRKDVDPYIYAADAINYSETKDQLAISQAIDWYKLALEKKDNVNIRIGLGDAYRKIPGNGGVAMDNYMAAVKLDPKNSLGYSRIGRLWYATRANYPDALENYNKAKDADPTNPLPYKYLADAYNKVGKPELANENVNKYYELSDKSDEDKVLLANVKFQNKQYDNAIATGEELLKGDMKKPSLYRLLAWSYFEKGNMDMALKNMNSFFAKEVKKNIIPLDYDYMGRIYLDKTKWDSADHYFRKSVEAEPDSAASMRSYVKIAEQYGALRNDTAYAAAAYWYGRIAQEKKDPRATDYFNWGKWAYYGKKYDVAEEAYRMQQEKFSDNASAVNSAIYWRGRTAAAIDGKAETGAAVSFYNQYLDATASDTARDKKDLMQVYQYMAYYYYNQKDKTNMVKYAKAILAIEPDNKFAGQVKDYAAAMK